MEQSEREKKRKEMETLYRGLITELKILYIRAQYNKEKTNEERYKKAYRTLELIQERRHLTEIGKQGKHKDVYIATLKMVVENYKGNRVEEVTLDNIIDRIQRLCEEYDIEDRDDTEKSLTADSELEK